MTLFRITERRAGHKECDSINKVERECEALKSTLFFHDGEESSEERKKKKRQTR